MRVPHQHPDVSMTPDRSDFGRRQSYLQEAAESFAAQVVEMEVRQAARRRMRSQATPPIERSCEIAVGIPMLYQF
jgi:hypothetical protein